MSLSKQVSERALTTKLARLLLGFRSDVVLFSGSMVIRKLGSYMRHAQKMLRPTAYTNIIKIGIGIVLTFLIGSLIKIIIGSLMAFVIGSLMTFLLQHGGKLTDARGDNKGE